MSRGGRKQQQGTPGTQYANRSDLRSPKPPAMVLPGQEYGEQARQVEMQRAVPSPVPAVQAEWTPPPPPIGLYEPTTRPDEPVQHGLASGPGGGPEVLGFAASETVWEALRQDALASGSKALLSLAERAIEMGQ